MTLCINAFLDKCSCSISSSVFEMISLIFFVKGRSWGWGSIILTRIYVCV